MDRPADAIAPETATGTEIRRIGRGQPHDGVGSLIGGAQERAGPFRESR